MKECIDVGHAAGATFAPVQGKDLTKLFYYKNGFKRAIAELLGMTQSAISHQLKILKDANLVANRREGKTIYYFLSDDHVRTIIAKGFEHLIEERNENNEEDL